MIDMGGYGFIIGNTKHFEITFMVNLTLDAPRFYFLLDLIKNKRKSVDDNAELMQLFIQELNTDWINKIGQKVRKIDALCYEILLLDGIALRIQFIEYNQEYKKFGYAGYEIYYRLYDGNKELDSWNSMEGNKASISFDKLFTMLDAK